MTARQAPYSASIPQLRPYQAELVDKVRAAYKSGFRCPLVVLSTGGGKTMIFSYITHGASQRNTAVLLAAHRKEIIRQISLSLARFGVHHQVIAPPDKVRAIQVAHMRAFGGKCFVDHNSSIMVGSVQTIVGRFASIDKTVRQLAERTGKPPSMMVIMDEAHHVTRGTQWGAVMDRYVMNPEFNAKGLLVTATPERLDGTGLGIESGGYADTLIEGPSMKWLMSQGFLSEYDIYGAPHVIDTDGVPEIAGEYVASELEKRADRPTIIGDIIENYREHAWKMRAVAFCVSVKASKSLAEKLTAAGIPAAHIDGGVDDAVRDQAIMDFASGKIWVLCQVNLVSEGFDLASIAQVDVTIDCLIDAAPTKSLVNFMQRGGRILRPQEGKRAVYLDHASNFTEHGLLEAERKWSLLGGANKRRESDGEKDIPIQTCQTCYCMFEPGRAIAAGRMKAASAGVEYSRPCCPVCMADMELKERKVKQRAGRLSKLEKEAIEAAHRAKVAANRAAQGQARTLEQLVAQGKSVAHAMRIIAERNKKEEAREAAELALEDWHKRHGLSVFQVFGVYSKDIQKMSAKELGKLMARIAEDDEARTGAAFHIS